MTATKSTTKRIEMAGIIAALLTKEDGRCSRVELERLADDPTTVDDALASLHEAGGNYVRHAGDDVEVLNATELRQKSDQLGGVVSHTLIHEGRDGLTIEQVALACQRRPASEFEWSEIALALSLLVTYDLAAHVDDLWFPTLAAIKGDELSF